MRLAIRTSGIFFRHYTRTILALLAVIFIAVEDVFFDTDVFNTIISFLDNSRYLETEEVAVSLILLGGTFGIDQYRMARRQKRKRELEVIRLGVARSTLASVHDVVNNTLNNLLLVKMEAETGRPMSPETLSLFEGLIDGLAAELRNMGESEVISTRDLSLGFSVLERAKK